MFVNPEVPLESLPTLEELDWQPLHRNFVVRLEIRKLAQALTLCASVVVAQLLVAAVAKLSGFSWLFPWVWILVVAWIGVSLAWPVLEVPRRGYAVRDKDIAYKSGVLWQTETVVPYNRVQHAETGSGPIDRYLSLARLTVFTAGTAGGDLRIDGLGDDVAERLRVFIIDRLRGLEERAEGAAAVDGADS